MKRKRRTFAIGGALLFGALVLVLSLGSSVGASVVPAGASSARPGNHAARAGPASTAQPALSTIGKRLRRALVQERRLACATRDPRAAAQGSPGARGRAQPAHRTSRERAGPRRPALARCGEHARAEPQLRRDPVPRRRLQLRAAGHERRSRRHAVRPDRERGLPGVRRSRPARPSTAPLGITTLWSGFGGVCQNNGDGDPVVLYDQLAGRWVITQFAGVSVPTDECVAVSTTSDATGSWFNRYGFHLGHSQLLRLPAPRRVAGRVLHDDERLQLGRDRVPRPAAVRVQPRRDARRQRRDASSPPGTAGAPSDA